MLLMVMVADGKQKNQLYVISLKTIGLILFACLEIMPFIIIATKCDKLPKSKVKPALSKLANTLKVGVGNVYGVSAGTAVITATSSNGSSNSVSIKVNKTNINVNKIIDAGGGYGTVTAVRKYLLKK